jgi:predicted ester cyclase
MNTPMLVEEFYERIWNRGDLAAVSDRLATDFRFRGSLGNKMTGQLAFENYVCSIRSALADYRCEILACVAEDDHAFAQMRFSGRHVGQFRGHAPTGKSIQWFGAALFRFENGAITELWVLGDLASLDACWLRTGRIVPISLERFHTWTHQPASLTLLNVLPRLSCRVKQFLRFVQTGFLVQTV